MRIQRTQVRVRGALVVHAHQDALEKARDSRASFAMPEVRFRCRDDHGLLACVNSHHLSVGTNLDGITQRSSCAVALGGVDLRGLDADLLDDRQRAPLLSRSIWRRQRGTPAVLVHLAASQQAKVPPILIEVFHLKADRRCGLPSCIPIGREVVGETAAQVGVHPSGAAANVAHGAQTQVDTADDRSFACIELVEHQVQLPRVRRHER
mmetsp:Transcript_113352/g.283904  ORF Transcript_113352/g.283904 Transcript_113352/m.283904 type:complete len:208 (+) Transcript_113352:771-1394(+)